MDDGDVKLQSLLKNAINSVCSPGTFACGGKIPIDDVPNIQVEGIGRLRWPVGDSQVKQLKTLMEKAPFGKGDQTLFDEKVRKALHIDASKITISAKFKKYLNDIGSQIREDLDIGTKINMHLHKLVLYEQGGKFNWHQDTEKSKGMFGSLVVQLPTHYEGGELQVKHGSSTKNFQNNKEKGENNFWWSAFYSDCLHRVTEVTEGIRITMLFDLVQVDTNIGILKASINIEAKQQLEEFVQAIRKLVTSKRFILPLDHEYSDSNRKSIKGKDRGLINLLQDMKDHKGDDLFYICLGSAERHETGTGEEGYYGDDFDIDETTDDFTCTSLPHSFLPGKQSFSCELDDHEKEELFADGPYKTENEGHQGNYAGSMDHWYKSSFVMFWLSEHHFGEMEKCDEDFDSIETLNAIFEEDNERGRYYLKSLAESSDFSAETTATRALQLEEKNIFISAIKRYVNNCNEGERFFETVSAAVKKKFVSWDELIPALTINMNPLDKHQTDFLISIEDSAIQERFLRAIELPGAKGLLHYLQFCDCLKVSVAHLVKKEWREKQDLSYNLALLMFCSTKEEWKEDALAIAQELQPKYYLAIKGTNIKTLYESLIKPIWSVNNYACKQNFIRALITFHTSPKSSESKSYSERREIEKKKEKKKLKFAARWKEVMARCQSESLVILPLILKRIEKDPQCISFLPCSILVSVITLSIKKETKISPACLEILLPFIFQNIKTAKGSYHYSNGENHTTKLLFPEIATITVECALEPTQQAFIELLIPPLFAKEDENVVLSFWNKVADSPFIIPFLRNTLLTIAKMDPRLLRHTKNSSSENVVKKIFELAFLHLDETDSNRIRTALQQFQSDNQAMSSDFSIHASVCDIIFLSTNTTWNLLQQHICDDLIQRLQQLQPNPYPNPDHPIMAKDLLSCLVRLISQNHPCSDSFLVKLMNCNFQQRQKVFLEIMTSDVVNNFYVSKDLRVSRFVGIATWLIQNLRQFPLYSWRIPASQSPLEVRSFLLSKEKEIQVKKGQFASIVQARKDARRLQQMLNQFSCTTSSAGSGRSARVILTKTKKFPDPTKTKIALQKLVKFVPNGSAVAGYQQQIQPSNSLHQTQQPQSENGLFDMGECILPIVMPATQNVYPNPKRRKLNPEVFDLTRDD